MADRRTYRTFGLLDIGTCKTVAAVIVAEQSPSFGAPSLRLAGLGLQRSRGIKAGVLTEHRRIAIIFKDDILLRIEGDVVPGGTKPGAAPPDKPVAATGKPGMVQ